MRYRYISYKYSRKVSPDTALQNIWETFGTWAVPVASGWRPPTDVFETPEQITARADDLERVVATKTMPIGNLTGMTSEERALVVAWVTQGASTER